MSLEKGEHLTLTYTQGEHHWKTGVRLRHKTQERGLEQILPWLLQRQHGFETP